MKCFEHPEKEAVGTCSRCHKGLCEDSVKKTWKHLYCDRCYQGAMTKSKVTIGFFKVLFFGGIIIVIILLAIAYYK